MIYTAEIKIMPLKDLLDPAGKAVESGLSKLGIRVDDVRIGKHIQLRIEADSQADAQKIADEAIKKLLANPVMEKAEMQIVQAS